MRRVLLLAVATILLTATAAVAKPVGGGPPPAPPPTTPASTSSGPVGTLGGTDVLQGLGATDANCDSTSTGQIAINCNSDGFAASPFPPSNYGPDVNVDRGVTDPGGTVIGFLMDLQSGVFTFVAYIVAGIVMLLSAAMSFDPFRTNQVQIGNILHGALGAFSWPLMALAVLIIAGIGLKHMFSRQHGRGAGYIAGAVGAMVLAIAVLSNVGATLGPADDLANGLTSTITGALSGHPTATGGFAQAEPSIWQASIEQPWCAMEFGSIDWCMSKISPTMATARDDVLANHMDAVLGDQDPGGTLTAEEKPNEIKRLAAAKTNGELFLSFITNSDVRNGKNDSWTLYNAVKNDPAGGPQLLTIRSSSGWVMRGIIMLFGFIAGGFFVATLVYIAWMVAMAALWFILMLLAGAGMLLAVVFGDKGMSVFKNWASLTIGALIIKVVYAGYLGVLLAITGFVLTMQVGWFLSWMIMAVVWSMGWFKRKALLDMLSGGHHQHHEHALPGAAAAYGVGRYAMKRSATRSGTKSGTESAIHNTQHDYYHAGDTHSYNLHVHPPNSNGYHRERVPNVREDIEGTAHELEPPGDE